MQLLCFNSLWKQIGQKASYISKKFQSINWLSVYERVHQCIVLEHLNLSRIPVVIIWMKFRSIIKSRNNFPKLKIPFQKTNMGQKGLSHIGSSTCNNLPWSMRKTTTFNTFKHILKKQYLDKLTGSWDC